MSNGIEVSLFIAISMFLSASAGMFLSIDTSISSSANVDIFLSVVLNASWSVDMSWSTDISPSTSTNAFWFTGVSLAISASVFLSASGALVLLILFCIPRLLFFISGLISIIAYFLPFFFAVITTILTKSKLKQ